MIRVRAAVFSLVLASAGLVACGGAGSSRTKSDLMSPNVVAISPPRPLSAVQTAAFRRGEDVIGRAGCLACHTIDQYGNNGPGPPLSHIGSMLSGRAIASSLRNPTAPMPSFAGLAQSDPKQFEDLVVFLSTLR